ncbi:MAG: serine/threonine-protein kinase, partial [Myxococcota bacterium]
MTRYELVERIGSGGMAEIFRGKALAAGGFEKLVAIKRILPHLSQDKRFVELLLAEARVLSYLRHRNIVQIFDVGLWPDGQYFLVMEYVDGADLNILQSGLDKAEARLPVDLGLYIGSEICEALEHAHSARGPDGKPMRLVHRDVSPSNVLLSRSGVVKLSDFGIAKRPEEVTRHGGLRGKFAYISPEQASNQHVDGRSDVFSVGILLFEILLGQRLFSKMNDFAALLAVREGRIPRPSEVDPQIDPKLDRILSRALAQDPDDRYDKAGDLGRALRDLRYSIPATGGDPSQALAEMMSRYALRRSPSVMAARVEVADELSEVQLSSAPSFTLTGHNQFDRDQTYANARQLLDSFEEEVTRALDRSELEADIQRAVDRQDNRASGAAGRPVFGIGDDEIATKILSGEDVKTMVLDTRKHGGAPSGAALAGASAERHASSGAAEPSGYEHAQSSRFSREFEDDGDDTTAIEPESSRHAAELPYARTVAQPLPSHLMPARNRPAAPAPPAPASPSAVSDALPSPVSLVGTSGQTAPSDVGPPRPGGNGGVSYQRPYAYNPPMPMAVRPIQPGGTSQVKTAPSRRSVLLLGAGVIAAGVTSFFVAGAVLSDDDSDEPGESDAAPRPSTSGEGSADVADGGADTGDAGAGDAVDADDGGAMDAGAAAGAAVPGDAGPEPDAAAKPA